MGKLDFDYRTDAADSSEPDEGSRVVGKLDSDDQTDSHRPVDSSEFDSCFHVAGKLDSGHDVVSSPEFCSGFLVVGIPDFDNPTGYCSHETDEADNSHFDSSFHAEDNPDWKN